MEFPEKSRSTTDRLFTWEEVRKLLDKESMRRAEYLSRILETLREKYGDEVTEIAAQVIYNIGYEKGAQRASLMQEHGQPNDLPNLAHLVSHEIAQLYLGNTAEIHDEQLVIREDYCPLIKKWNEMGFPDEKIIGYCQLFDQVDKGMVEGYNPDFVAELTGCSGLARKGYCGMVVSRRPEKDAG
jgi:hypothetical protein